MESRVLAEPVLVGRERELEELQRYLASAKEGRGKTVFVSAEAGIGKTRLMREFLNSLKRKEGIVTLSGWCLFNAGVPYFPFIEAFSNYYSTLGYKRNKEEAELNSWLKGPAKADLRGKLEYLSPQALKDQTFTAVAKTIHSIAARNPVILLIEDIHWADSASLALIHYIARAINDSERVLVLATFRSEEITTTSEGYPHQLVETLCMMRREDLFSEIKLANLDHACVVKMAESMLGGSLQQELAEKLAGESEGNPLFIVESLRMLHERKSIVKENNEWRLAVDELGIPFKIKDIIIQRLACLNNAQRRILDAASVIGEEFDVGLLGAVVEQDNLDVLETLNVIASSTSLVRVDENQYRFDHARSREVLYEALAPPLKRAYHGRIAEKLERTKSGARLLSDLAYHYAEAGNKDKAVKYALAAAKEELAKWSNAQAIKHFEYVLENILEWQAVEKRTALEGLGDAYAASSKYGEAIKTFDKLAGSETSKVKLRALRKAMDASYAQGDRSDLLLEYARKAQELGVNDGLEMARVLRNRGKAYGWSGRGDVKQDLMDYDAALRVFEEENSLADVAEALLRSGQVGAIFFEDLHKKGLGRLLRSIAMFRELGDTHKEIESTRWMGTSFYSVGLLSEARHELATVLRIGEKSDLFVELAQASLYFGEHGPEFEGKIAEAIFLTLKGLEYSKRTDAKWVQGIAYAFLTRQYSLLGDLKKADAYYDKMINLPPEVLSNLNLVLTCPMAKGVYFAAKGKWEESNLYFQKLLESFETSPMRGFEISVRGNYAWALEKQGRVKESRVQLDVIQNLHQQTEAEFRQADIQLSLLLPRKVQIGEEFMMRLDLVNVARNSGTLVRIEGLLHPDLTLTYLPGFCQIKNGSIEMNQKRIDPFQVETIKFRAICARAGSCKLEPCVRYVDHLGEARSSITESIVLTAQPGSNENKPESVVKPQRGKFGSEAAEQAFNFLVSAFEEDYVNRRLPQESSGWRTLMEIVRKGHVSKHNMYGRSGKGGKVISELGHLGLVEPRFFLGESGRGGRVLKMRVCYENENVKRQLHKCRRQ